jgi:hypothetical protein
VAGLKAQSSRLGGFWQAPNIFHHEGHEDHEGSKLRIFSLIFLRELVLFVVSFSDTGKIATLFTAPSTAPVAGYDSHP